MPKLKPILSIILLPLVLIAAVITSKRTWYKKALFIIAVLLFVFPTWWRLGQQLYQISRLIMLESGLINQNFPIQVSGTSMQPTIKDGDTVYLNNPKKKGIERGDIISFANEQTKDLHYLKRLIGLPGDKLSLVNGSVYINGQRLDEPYLVAQTKTFGNTFALDCEAISLPPNQYFVMGDNRTLSYDSRVIGLIEKSVIDGVIKPEQKPAFATNVPESQFNPITFDPKVFIKNLNQARDQAKQNPLITNSVLQSLAEQRSQDIVANFDSWKSGTTKVEDLLTARNYKYNLIHEYVTFGYLDATEVADQIFDNGFEKELFLSPKYLEVGIGSTLRQHGECTYPVINILISWPSVPTYDPETIKYWENESQISSRIVSQLQSWVGSGRFKEEELRSLITVTSESSVIAARIASKMKNQQWLSGQDYSDIRKYERLVSEANAGLTKFFGPPVKGISTQAPFLF